MGFYRRIYSQAENRSYLLVHSCSNEPVVNKKKKKRGKQPTHWSKISGWALGVGCSVGKWREQAETFVVFFCLFPCRSRETCKVWPMFAKSVGVLHGFGLLFLLSRPQKGVLWNETNQFLLQSFLARSQTDRYVHDEPTPILSTSGTTYCLHSLSGLWPIGSHQIESALSNIELSVDQSSIGMTGL